MNAFKLTGWILLATMTLPVLPALADFSGEQVSSPEIYSLTRMEVFKKLDSKITGHFKVMATLGSPDELNPIGTIYIAFEKQLFDDFDTYAVSVKLQNISSIRTYWNNSNFSPAQGQWLDIRGNYYDDKSQKQILKKIQIKLTDSTGVRLEKLEANL